MDVYSQPVENKIFMVFLVKKTNGNLIKYGEVTNKNKIVSMGNNY